MNTTRDEIRAEPPGVCPTEEVLRRFSVGKLPDHVLVRVGEHLERCADCSRAFDALGRVDDKLIGLLQRPTGADPVTPRAPARDACPEHETTLPQDGAGLGGQHVAAQRTDGCTMGRTTGDGGRFRILRPHAQGGLGAVFVALDAELNREVALKRILDQHADDAVSRQRFLLEAEVTGGLEHPGIVPVYSLAPAPMDGLSTPCGSSRGTASRKPSRSSGRPVEWEPGRPGPTRVPRPPLRRATRTRPVATTNPVAGRSSCASSCAASSTSAMPSSTPTVGVSCTGTSSRAT